MTQEKEASLPSEPDAGEGAASRCARCACRTGRGRRGASARATPSACSSTSWTPRPAPGAAIRTS